VTMAMEFSLLEQDGSRLPSLRRRGRSAIGSCARPSAYAD
jgi:hypothetical protein